MRIAINAQLLNTDSTYRGAGVSSYSRHLLTALAAQSRGSPQQLTVFLNDRRFQAPGLELRHTRWPAHRPLARIAWEQTVLPVALGQMDAALVHGLVNVLPLATRVPGVVTVHDLSFLRLPERFPRHKRAYLTGLCRASVAKARRVIAVSRQTADDVLSYFGVDSRRVEVVYNGVGARFRQLPPADVAAFRQRRGLPGQFLLYVGTLEPRKNLPLLLRAYAGWQAASPAGQETALVLAGAKGWHYREIFALVTELGLSGRVHFPGFLPEEELPLWYNAAAGFVYPSLFEGFGLPVLEAMAAGTPVICSDAASLGEIAGDAALLFPAADQAALQSLLERLLTEPGLAAELRARGIRRAEEFSWTRAAEETGAVYDAVLRSG